MHFSLVAVRVPDEDVTLGRDVNSWTSAYLSSDGLTTLSLPQNPSSFSNMYAMYGINSL